MGCWCFIAAHEQALSNMRVPQRKRLGPLRCPRNPTTHTISFFSFMEHSASPFSLPPLYQRRGVAVESLLSDPRTGPMGPTQLQELFIHTYTDPVTSSEPVRAWQLAELMISPASAHACLAARNHAQMGEGHAICSFNALLSR
jgi:hypothetical protein